eukprot:15115154-Ditylum_brightwellii.AAC.1
MKDLHQNYSSIEKKKPKEKIKSDDEESIFFDEENKDDECVEQNDDDRSLHDDGSIVADRDQKLSSSMGRLSLNPKPPQGLQIMGPLGNSS